jgi:hypothetical protein
MRQRAVDGDELRQHRDEVARDRVLEPHGAADEMARGAAAAVAQDFVALADRFARQVEQGCARGPRLVDEPVSLAVRHQREVPGLERPRLGTGHLEPAASGGDDVEHQAVDALRVRLLGSASTPIDVRSRGTRHTIAAMRRHGVRRLVVQTSFGVGDTRGRLPWLYRLMFGLLLKPQIADTEQQEREVRASGLDWVLAQPVNLTDAVLDDAPFVSTQGDTRSMKVARRQVGRLLAEAVHGGGFVGCSVAVSGA